MLVTSCLAMAAGSKPRRLQAHRQVGFQSRAGALLPTPRQHNLSRALHKLQDLFLLCPLATKIFSVTSAPALFLSSSFFLLSGRLTLKPVAHNEAEPSLQSQDLYKGQADKGLGL